MDELRKKVLLDLCITPGTVLPMIAGVSLLMLSSILGAGWGFFGLLCCLVGLGFLVTNYMFNLDSIHARALEQVLAQKKAERNAALDILDGKLSSDRDPRDQDTLRNLRSLYDCFMDDVKEGKISKSVPQSMYKQIEDIFNGCVAQLERQHEIWRTSRKVTGDLRDGLMKQKDAILDEVEKSVQSLADVINEVRALGLKAHTGELSKLQERLGSQLAAAKATDQFVADLDKTDLSRFSEYEK
jgi:hypothetical protein